jgi:hypothetical protein
MRYALLMHYREPADGEISEEALAEARLNLPESWKKITGLPASLA